MATENVVASQIALGTIGAGVLNLLKQSKYVSLINDKSSTLNHAVLLITSAVGAAGIHVAWSASEHSLTITGLTAASVISGLWIWFKQWSIQYLVHRGAFGPVTKEGGQLGGLGMGHPDGPPPQVG